MSTLRSTAFLIVLTFIFLISPSSALAITITDDPQFLVMNLSTINELNWAADEEEWQLKVKPRVIAQLDDVLGSLPRGSDQRKLAWSTLMEYMNFPLDTTSSNSAYVIKIRRIFEVAEAKDLPVFIPLNGFQWWDELPELYNWWDADGTQTDPGFFARQDDPIAFKHRFINGYNPENKWNVEWQDWETPMGLNWRNWGGGGFRLAPPPNIIAHRPQTSLSYRQVLEDRLTAILEQIVLSSNELESRNKGYLFAGVSLGTEISLNASATNKDEFMPYGYRAIQDYACASNESPCSNALRGQGDLQQIRQQAVYSYLFDLSRLAAHLGVPKQRLYTHVWGEADASDQKFAPYAPAAFNLYSRPGMSFYGFAQNPYDSLSWQTAQSQFNHQPWGAVEYSLPTDPVLARLSLENIFDRTDGETISGQVVVFYNWSEHQDNPALPTLAEFLAATPMPEPCQQSDILTSNSSPVHDPAELSWRYLDPTAATPDQITLKFQKGLFLSSTEELESFAATSTSTSSLMPLLTPGVYTWYIESTGCNETQTRTSQPGVLTISTQTDSSVPWWVDRALLLLDRNRQP